MFSCESKQKNKTFQIFHLKPNEVLHTSDTLNRYGWYSKRRNDFFVIKHFDLKNKQHKVVIDSFVLEYIKKDSFLYKNKNSLWKLRFFRYGESIDENVAHVYNTDYTIHNQFAYDKEICNYYFDNKTGFVGSKYWTSFHPKEYEDHKSDIISSYFDDIAF